MMTVEERDFSGEVVEAIMDTPPFSRAAGIYRNFFTGEDDLAIEIVKGQWLPEDFEAIQGILASWYKA